MATHPMRSDQRLFWAQVLVWFIPALWAVNFLCARLAPGVVDPHVLALGRWGIAGLLLGWFARHEIWAERHQIWRDRWQYLVLGSLGMLVCGGQAVKLLGLFVAQGTYKAFDGVVGGCKAVGVDQVLVDGGGVAAKAQLGLDEFPVHFAQTGGD